MKRLITILILMWLTVSLASASSNIAVQGAVYPILTAPERRRTNYLYLSSNAVAWSPDSTKIAVGGSLGIWIYTSNFAEIAHLVSDTNQIVSIAWNSDSRMIAGAGGEGHIWIWDVTTGKMVQDFVGHATTITWNPHEDILASAGGNRFAFWDTSKGELIQKIEIPLFQKRYGEIIWSICWIADSNALAVVADRGIYVWDITHKEYLLSKKDVAHDIEIPGWYRPASCSPDGTELATSAGIFSSQTGNFVRGFASHEGRANSVRWSPDGSKVAINTGDKVVVVVDAVTGHIITELEGNIIEALATGYYDSIDWSPDGKWLAAAGGDGSVKIWNTDNFDLEAVIETSVLPAQ